MRVVVDATAAGDNSVGVCVSGWLAGWSANSASGDELHVVVSAVFAKRSALADLPHVVVHPFESGVLARVRAQHVTVPHLLRVLPADVLLATVPQLPFRPGGGAIVVVGHDFRHELRPEEFSRGRRALRWVEYRRAYRRANRIAAISERTRADLGRLHPEWLAKTVTVHHGGDHLPDRSVAPNPGERIALAFGHHVNKRPQLVMRAWAELLTAGAPGLPQLVIVGASPELAAELRSLRTELGIDERMVAVESFLDDADYAALLARVGIVVLASTFEGFGLPVIEGLRLRVPVVITPEDAMIEVGGPVVTVAADDTPAALARAVSEALRNDDDAARQAGAEWAAQFTWAASATGLRALCESALQGRKTVTGTR